jgi:hypothetical protein
LHVFIDSPFTFSFLRFRTLSSKHLGTFLTSLFLGFAMDPNKIEYIRSVFMDLCPKYAEWLVKKDILLQWILHFDQHSGDDKKLQEMIPRKEHREYLKAAFCHFQLREHLICITGDRGSGPEQGYEFALTNSRYGFKLKASGEKFQSLEAMDFFTGHKR